MFQRLITWTLVLGLWRRYGRLVKGLLAVLLALAVISWLHRDYLAYVEVSQNQEQLRLSFFVKWLLIALVCGSYWLFAKRQFGSDRPRSGFWFNAKSGSAKDRTDYASTEQKQGSSEAYNSKESVAARDPFSDIRQKTHLRTRGEVLIDQKKRAKSTDVDTRQ